jgi:hypothetical protein
VSLTVSRVAGIRDSRAENHSKQGQMPRLGKKRGNNLRTGNMERVAWTAIEGRQIESARGERVLLCGEEG